MLCIYSILNLNLFRWLYVICQLHRRSLMLHRQQWWENIRFSAVVTPVCDTLTNLLFTSHVSSECVFSFGTEIHHCMPETMEHRLLRSRKISLIKTVSSSSEYIIISFKSFSSFNCFNTHP